MEFLPDDLRDRLIGLARAAAQQHDWTWLEPVAITSRAHGDQPVWEIRSNSMAIGRSIKVLIRKSDLAVIEASYLPR